MFAYISDCLSISLLNCVHFKLLLCFVKIWINYKTSNMIKLPAVINKLMFNK